MPYSMPRVMFVDLDNMDNSEIFRLIEEKITKKKMLRLVGIHNSEYAHSKHLVEMHFDLVHEVPTKDQAVDLCIMMAIGYAIKTYGSNVQYTLLTKDNFGGTAVKLAEEAFGIELHWRKTMKTEWKGWYQNNGNRCGEVTTGVKSNRGGKQRGCSKSAT